MTVCFCRAKILRKLKDMPSQSRNSQDDLNAMVSPQAESSDPAYLAWRDTKVADVLDRKRRGEMDYVSEADVKKQLAQPC